MWVSIPSRSARSAHLLETACGEYGARRSGAFTPPKTHSRPSQRATQLRDSCAHPLPVVAQQRHAISLRTTTVISRPSVCR
jgi:hypothetical protein